MAFLQWNESYAVGIKDIDFQHKKLFELVNKLHNSLNNGHSRREVEVIINALSSYFDYHFTEEENFLKRINYPDMANYYHSSAELNDKLRTLKAQYSKARTGSPLVFLNFFKNWLTEHIQSLEHNLAVMGDMHAVV
jgi:hemerythrin-like metal-binding protein